MTQGLVAIKQVQKTSKEEIECLMDEIGINKACDSNYVARIYDTFEDQNYIYIVMEYIKGKNLRRAI